MRGLGACAAALLLPAAGSAETLMMPDREAFVGDPVVVWGVSTLANGTAYELDCGNGTTVAGNVADRSYISTSCTYAAEATYTATLTVGAESDTADIAAFDGVALAAVSPADARGLEINNAIQDGLRNLWITQQNRAANFPASPTTRWNYGYAGAEASMIALAFENQGYRLPDDGSAPTGVYKKYIVQRALNFVMEGLTTVALGTTPQGDDPCVGVPIDGDECTGLYQRRADVFHQSYTTGTSVLALAGVGPSLPLRTVAPADVPGSGAFGGTYIHGKTYAEILQRMANALTWGQIDDAFCPGFDCGGWYYNFNSSSSDGSTVGWVLLGLLDADAAGAVVPQWVRDEHGNGSVAVGPVLPNLNDDGSYDYQSAGPASPSGVSVEKVGVGLQGLAFIGENAGPRVDAVVANIDSWWNGGPGIGVDGWACSGGGGGGGNPVNKGCAYAMYNIFKGLRLQGIQTLPSVGRPAGPGAIPANDWYADYVDWLVANQGATGTWGAAMGFSCCGGSPNMEDAIAILILSPVALVLPDPALFSSIGLTHESGSTDPETNLVGTDHTVVSTARAANESPIPGTVIDIEVISGPNAGAMGQGVSNAQGKVFFTYTSNGNPGTDEIQASIGNLFSNIIEKIWEEEGGPTVCDVDENGGIDINDIRSIFGLIGSSADPGDPADLDGNGLVTINDARGCVLQCTLPRCAPVQ